MKEHAALVEARGNLGRARERLLSLLDAASESDIRSLADFSEQMMLVKRLTKEVRTLASELGQRKDAA